MSVGDEKDRILEEKSPGPSDLESVLLQDTVKEIQFGDGLTIDSKSSLYEAVRMMRRNKQGCVLVTRAGRLVGIFTERDALMKVLDTGIDLAHTPVSAYMSADPVSLAADAGVGFALNKMVLEGFHRLPVVLRMSY
ncbi:MAG TPA: CBS domain-containing protein [Candidatus Binataceae bacterium]|nr:CBS domain-containing protein [Candidatus Binataceae bacterium]